jgi:hypothetical protein
MPGDTEYNCKNCSRDGRLPGQNFGLKRPKTKQVYCPLDSEIRGELRSKGKAQFNLQPAMETQTGSRSPVALLFL